MKSNIADSYPLWLTETCRLYLDQSEVTNCGLPFAFPALRSACRFRFDSWLVHDKICVCFDSPEWASALFKSCQGKTCYYTNTNERPGELSRENMISSHVKITCYFHIWKDRRCYGYIINRAFRSKKKYFKSEMVWNFIGVYIINRTLHGRLEIRNLSSSVEKYMFNTYILFDFFWWINSWTGRYFTTLGSRGYFFLSILMVLGEAASTRRGAPRDKNNVSGALSNRKHGLFHIRYFGNDLWGRGNIFPVVWYIFEPVAGRKNASKEYNICAY